MKQRVADALQIVGALMFAVAGFAVNDFLGCLLLAVALVVAGVVVERS